jgi:lysophospholipase L1-like esterase
MFWRSVPPAIVCSLLLGWQVTANAELVLTNFSASRPLKIMGIGDSITDDCSINGAWRLYLQPLLQTNGYPFTFVGRQSSAAVAPSFTKVKHEGYCGAVIAPPGVFAVHSYTATNAYLLKIVADALAVTNNRPDLVLLLIGANDIGRGRDPYQVATQDMSKLLDLILSNIPNAHIIISKITSLQSANLPGLTYGAFATNVPIYNAALQSTVNQRRLLGQNVFLADMFSVVDYSTMFQSDHVHPNALGLRVMANEFLSRIEAITVRTNQFASTLVFSGDTWRYSDTGQDFGTNWTQASFDDSAWSNGVARFGYGDPAVTTPIGFGPDPANKYITTYFRKMFAVPWNHAVTNLNVRLARADGAVVWLNGQEVFRTNLPSGPISYTNLALSPMTSYTASIFYPTNLTVPALPGTNFLGVEIHQSLVTHSMLDFDLELLGTGYFVSAPSLSVQWSGEEVVLSWPVSNATSFKLYSTTDLNVGAAWSEIAIPVQTNSGQIVVTQSPDGVARFFRLQQE